MKHSKCCILVIDFGSQYTQLLLRRIRELGVYYECHDWHINESQVYKLNPNGVILSGGPYSVVQKHVSTPYVPDSVFRLGVPVLGICYGMQIMTTQLGGVVRRAEHSGEFGCSKVEIINRDILVDGIYDDYLNNLNHAILDVWMSHEDIVVKVPEGFIVVGVTKNHEISIIAHKEHRLFGLQFHPEVTHTKKGKNILKRFVIDICGCLSVWKPVNNNSIDEIVTNIRKLVGNEKVILFFSGGIDSFVTALLLKYAIGNQFICIFIDTGLLYFNELDRIRHFSRKYCDLNILCISEETRFLKALVQVINPEEKRKIIGRVFMEIFESQVRNFQNIKWLAQGTICSDVIESGVSPFCTASMIKSHHNVGGIPDTRNIKLLEPIRNLFKDEVRSIALDLGLPHDIVYRHPFPGPGLAIRILGEVKKEYCEILHQSDRIFYEELQNENLYDQISQAFSVFLPIYSVGIQGDQRKYRWVIALRAIETIDFMTARWARLPYNILDKVSSRIVNEISNVSRVVYDISGKPPATIEWE